MFLHRKNQKNSQNMAGKKKSLGKGLNELLSAALDKGGVGVVEKVASAAIEGGMQLKQIAQEKGIEDRVIIERLGTKIEIE